MGHSYPAILPRTKEWRQVIALISGGADVEDVASASAKAAERSLHEAGDDPALRHTFWLLSQIPLASKAEVFSERLRQIGIYVTGPTTLPAICSALILAVDRTVQSLRKRTDLGELAQLSAAESLTAIAGREMGLFGLSKSEADTAAALAALAKPLQFGVLAVDFFARLTWRHLDYYLSRELPLHVGINQRFRSIREHREFEAALEAHCNEAAQIMGVFATDWYSKRTYEGGIKPKDAGGFVHHALEKIHDELRLRRGAHG